MSQETSNFRSQLERRIAMNLDMRDVDYSYESMRIEYYIPARYTPDFVLDNGIIIEAKGYFRVEERRKHMEIRRQHPELDIRFVFSNVDAKIEKAKMTCGEWCEKNNFLYAEEVIPNEWIYESK